MARDNNQVLFTALAFIGVLLKSKKASSAPSAQEVDVLAELIKEFCITRIAESKPDVSDESGVVALDEAVNRHIAELKQKEETRLPEDRGTLLKFYDRLQVRKLRREHRGFYETATADELADLVLSLLDEEIADTGALS